MLHTIRASPCLDHLSITAFDDLLHEALSRVTNSALSDIAGLQSTLLVNEGDLGIRSIQSLASSVFLASAESTASLQRISLGRSIPYVYSFVSQTLAVWLTGHSDLPPADPKAF